MNASPDIAAAGGGVVACVFTALFAVLALAAFAFWIWMLIDAIKRLPSEGNTKLIWILVIVFTGVIGALIYYFVQRPKNPPKT
jgi:prolipoprotein diacylglyceryltransferase